MQAFVEGCFVTHDLNIVIPGKSGVPEWVSHKSMGREIRIELPKN